VSELRFRVATAADLPALVALYADDALGATREDRRDPPAEAYRHGFARMMAMGEANQIHLAVLDGRIVGCAQLVMIPGVSQRGMLRAEVEAVRTASDLRGRGIGTALMRHLIALARARGARQMQLTSHASRAEAHRFYERLGFKATHVGMKLQLDEVRGADP
jgi:GNAT superfamily N-acetyltransferase